MRAMKLLVPGLFVALLAVACGDSTTDDNPPGTQPPVVTTLPPTTPPSTAPPTTLPPTTVTTPPPDPIVYLPNETPDKYQIWNTDTDVIALSEPRRGADEVYRFGPNAKDVMTTGRRASVSGSVWVEVQLTASATGWVPDNNLVHQITPLDSQRPASWVVTGLAADDRLNVRSHPGVDHPVVATLATKTVVKSTGLRSEVQGSVWAQIEFAAGELGWVNTRYLAPDVVILPDDTPAVYQVVGIQGGERLNVRRGPGVHEPVVTTLAADAKDIKSTGNRAEVSGSLWREIALSGGGVGWVNATYLEIQPPPDPVNPPCRPGGDTFCPHLEVSRATAAAFLSRALGLTGDGGKDWFTDDNGSMFETEINRLAAAGILRGCDSSASKVCPDKPASREMVAAMFSRALGLTDDGGKDWFTDDDGSKFETEINMLAAAGVARACNPPDGTKFCPDKPIVRGQIAAWLVRGFDLPSTSKDFWSDDDGTAFEAEINAITAAGIAKK